MSIRKTVTQHACILRVAWQPKQQLWTTGVCLRCSWYSYVPGALHQLQTVGVSLCDVHDLMCQRTTVLQEGDFGEDVITSILLNVQTVVQEFQTVYERRENILCPAQSPVCFWEKTNTHRYCAIEWNENREISPVVVNYHDYYCCYRIISHYLSGCVNI